MISELTALDKGDPAVKEKVIAEINRLYRRRDFLLVRYTWQEMKDVASYLRDNHGFLQGATPEYVDAILKPYNEIEYAHIFAIVKALGTGEDLKPLRDAVRADSQRMRRMVKKLTREDKNTGGFMKKIKNKIGVK